MADTPRAQYLTWLNVPSGRDGAKSDTTLSAFGGAKEKLTSQRRQQLRVNPTKTTIAHAQHMVTRLRSSHHLRNHFIHRARHRGPRTHGRQGRHCVPI